MRILILGGTGLLGHKVFQTLQQRFPETYCAIRDAKDDERIASLPLFQSKYVIDGVDAKELPALERTLAAMQPQVIVNCIGIVKQRTEAKAALPSIALNALLPHWLADRSRAWNGRLIHISTDCVFSGQRGPYTEDSPSDAEDLYGKTKYLGEVTTHNALTLRTSIIGREFFHRHSLLEWLLRQRGQQITGYKNALYSGLTTNHLAEVVSDIIEFHPRLWGLYQVTSQTISKHDLLCLLREAYRLDVEIVPDQTFHCDRSLLGDKFRRVTGYVCPSWPELAAQLASDLTSYEL